MSPGKASDANRKIHPMTEIENEHFGRCLWQVILEGRTIMVELFHYPKANSTAIVVKHFEKAIPRSGSGKPWPDQIASYVYLPVDDTNTWDGLKTALTEIEAKAMKKPSTTDAALLIDESHERERRDQASLDWMRHETELIRLEARQADIIAIQESVATQVRQELKRVEAEIAEKRSILQYKNEGHPGT